MFEIEHRSAERAILVEVRDMRAKGRKFERKYNGIEARVGTRK